MRAHMVASLSRSLSLKKRISVIFLDHIKKVREHYDRVDTEYASSDATAEPIIKDLLRTDLGNRNPICILDLGSGSGRYLPLAKNMNVVGIDLSRNILMQAKKYGTDLIQGEMHHLPFRQSIFDFVYCMSLLGEIQPLTEDILDEIIRVTQKGCFFIFTVVSRSKFRYVKKLLFFLSSLTRISILSPFSETRENVEILLRSKDFQVLDIVLIKGTVSHFYVRAKCNC